MLIVHPARLPSGTRDKGGGISLPCRGHPGGSGPGGRHRRRPRTRASDRVTDGPGEQDPLRGGPTPRTPRPRFQLQRTAGPGSSASRSDVSDTCVSHFRREKTPAKRRERTGAPDLALIQRDHHTHRLCHPQVNCYRPPTRAASAHTLPPALPEHFPHGFSVPHGQCFFNSFFSLSFSALRSAIWALSI